MEADIQSSERPDSILNYIQSKTTGFLNYVRTIDSTGEIILCGQFESVKGLGAKLNKNGTLAWAYLFSLPCEVLMLDSKQEYVLMVLRFEGRGMEIHRYKVSDGSKSFIFEYGVTSIGSFQDGMFKNDYYWFIGYLNTDMCFILKISSTRRYVYNCQTNSKMWGMLIPDKSPIFVGNNNLNVPFLIKIDDTAFNITLNYQINNIYSNYMSLKSSSNDDSNLMWSFSLTTDNSLYITYLNTNSSSFTWTKKYNYKLSQPVLHYSKVFDEYFILAKDPVNNRACFIRFDYNDGSITFYKCNANNSFNTYNVYTTSLHTDSDSSIYFGGQLKNENFFVYRTGVELGDNSCIFQSSIVYPETFYSISNFDITYQNKTFTLTVDLTGRWINRTDRAVVLETTLSTTNYCAPYFKIPLLRQRHYTQRFMETLPATCPGYNLTEIPTDTQYTFTVLDGSNTNTDASLTIDGKNTQIVNSFWMTMGSYKFSVNMFKKSDPNNVMTIMYDATTELTAFMVIVVTFVYLAFFIIAVQAVISQDYFCIKHMIYSAQFIHLLSLLAVNLPPPMVYFVQRMSIFGMIEGIFSKAFFLSSFNLMKIDRFYRINYETSSFISNQILSVIILVCITAGMALRNMNWRKKNTDDNHSNVVDLNKVEDIDFKIPEHLLEEKKTFKELALIYGYNVFSFLYPYILLHCVLDIMNMNNKNGVTGFSFGLACFIMMVTFKLSLLKLKKCVELNLNFYNNLNIRCIEMRD